MQYTPHYNLNLPEGTDIVNPLIQDNPNYSAIDTALYNNKLRVIGTATHVKTGTNHAITLGDSDINQFKFVATGDYAAGDTFSVDGVTVTARVADGSSIPSGAFKINSTVLAILDGTILNLMNVDGTKNASEIYYDNTSSGLSATKVQGAIDEVAGALNENASVVINSGGVFVTRTKHTVCWSIEKTPTSIAHGTVLATELPAPMTTIYTSVSMANGQSLPVVIEPNGTMSVYYPTTQTVARIDASGSYHTNS